MVEKLDFTVHQLSELEREAMDLAGLLDESLALLVNEHIVSFVWLSCHLGILIDG